MLSAPAFASMTASSITQASETCPSIVQPKAVEMPASISGRLPAGRLSRNATTAATCATACSGVMLMLDWLCRREAETGRLIFSAPAAMARSAPLRLGTSAATQKPPIASAPRTTASASAICGSSLGETKEPTSISASPTPQAPGSRRSSPRSAWCA